MLSVQVEGEYESSAGLSAELKGSLQAAGVSGEAGAEGRAQSDRSSIVVMEYKKEDGAEPFTYGARYVKGYEVQRKGASEVLPLVEYK